MKNLLLVLLGTVIALVLCEILSRMFIGNNNADVIRLGRNQIPNPLPGIRYLYESESSHKEVWPSDPNSYFDKPDNSITYNTNRYGFRDDNFELKLSSRFRIAILGDSFCWGSGVRCSDRFSDILEEELNNEHLAGLNYEVYNFSLPGFNTENEASLYDYVVRVFDPDILILSFFLNDINLPPDLYMFPRGILKEKNRKGLYEYSALLRLIYRFFDRFQIEREFVANGQDVYKSSHPAFIKMKSKIEKIARIADQARTPRLMLMFPWLIHLDDGKYPFVHAHELVQEVAISTGFEVIDLMTAYSSYKEEKLWVHEIDHHPNKLAHKIAAESLLPVVSRMITTDSMLSYRMRDRRKHQHVDNSLLIKRDDWFVPFGELADKPDRTNFSNVSHD